MLYEIVLFNVEIKWAFFELFSNKLKHSLNILYCVLYVAKGSEPVHDKYQIVTQ